MSPDTTAISKTCPICWEPFTSTGRQARHRVYCSPECKRTAAARREVDRTSHPNRSIGAPSPLVAPLPQPAAQRDCPHCGRAVTIVALLTTPEAARPQMPAGVIPLRP